MEALLDNRRRDLLAGFWLTIRLTVVSGIGSLILGTLLAAMRVSPGAGAARRRRRYVNMFRNTPLTLVIFFCCFGLGANLGLEFSDDPRHQQLLARRHRPVGLHLGVRLRGDPVRASTPCRSARPRRPARSG